MAPNGHFTNISVKGNPIAWSGGVKKSLNDKFIAVGDLRVVNGTGVIYHVARNGGVLAKTTITTCSACFVGQFTLTSGRVILPSVTTTNVYAFPGGGSPIATFGTFEYAVGSAVSV